ncbi:kinase [Actinoplanes sp. NPDC049316]|uniref:kinase n=1 Tax=Actinoplanes sp. NPDC049316 TaxID=3154727 RepID=UPI0034203E63
MNSLTVGKIEQDYLRRVVLREHDSSNVGPVAPGFITAVARSALDTGYHVVLEGILHADRYGTGLRNLLAEHPGPSHVFYLDVSFEETVRRHASRAADVNFTAEDMRAWYAGKDLLGVAGEHVIGEDSTFEQTVATILHISALTDLPPRTACPNRCPRCADDRSPQVSGLQRVQVSGRAVAPEG